MTTISLPYITWRDGRPRFTPGPRQRKQGFASRDLRHADGTWFTVEEAARFARQMQQAIREAQHPPRTKRPIERERGTLGNLLDEWSLSDEFRAKKQSTQTGYRLQMNSILWKPGTPVASRTTDNLTDREPFSLMPTSQIGWPEMKGFFEYQKKTRGHHMARHSLATISSAWTWGTASTKWRLPTNPRIGKTVEQPKGRLSVYEDHELRALIAAADLIGHPSIGDSLLLGLFTGQRQGDRLTLHDLGMIDGRRHFRQNKTAAIVQVKEAPRLTERLTQARARVAALTLKFGLRERPAEIVINELTGQAYNGDRYRRTFAKARTLATHGAVRLNGQVVCAADTTSNAYDWVLAPCPSLAGKTDQDLRDTAVTWLYRAGNDIQSICDVTGHSYAAAQLIVKHYLARNAKRADGAIDKLVDFMAREGMEV